MGRIYKKRDTTVTPTGPGKILLLMLFAMLIGSINYSNNMAYILCFLLTGLMIIAYLSTRNNLKGLHIGNIRSQPVFAGEELRIDFELHNGTRGRRGAIFPIIYGAQNNEGFTGPFSVAAYSRASIQVSFITPKRGRFVLDFIYLK